MSFFCRILYWIAMSFCIIWVLLLLLLKLLLFPVWFFLPEIYLEKFDETVTKAALKILWFLWRLIRACLLFTLVLVLFVLSPILWPIYLGIAFFCPGFVINLFSIKLF